MTCTCLLAPQAFQVLITDKAGVAGLEPTTLAVAADAAKAAGHKNATAAAGPWLLQLSYNTYASVLAYAKDRALRKRFYLAMRSVATSGKTDNAPIVRQMLQLRQRMARLLGYKTYADYAFRSRVSARLLAGLVQRPGCIRVQHACYSLHAPHVADGDTGQGEQADGAADGRQPPKGD